MSNEVGHFCFTIQGGGICRRFTRKKGAARIKWQNVAETLKTLGTGKYGLLTLAGAPFMQGSCEWIASICGA